MSAYAVRDNDNPKHVQPATPKEAYKVLSDEQFIIFAKCYLKDNVIENSKFSTDARAKLNNFFNDIPDFLINFSSETHKKLLIMYISSNIRNGFNLDIDESMLFKFVSRLQEIDPRK